MLMLCVFQRLTRSLPGEQRDTVLQAYISNDLLESCTSKQVRSYECNQMFANEKRSFQDFSLSLLCFSWKIRTT